MQWLNSSLRNKPFCVWLIVLSAHEELFVQQHGRDPSLASHRQKRVTEPLVRYSLPLAASLSMLMLSCKEKNNYDSIPTYFDWSCLNQFLQLKVIHLNKFNKEKLLFNYMIYSPGDKLSTTLKPQKPVINPLKENWVLQGILSISLWHQLVEKILSTLQICALTRPFHSPPFLMFEPCLGAIACVLGTIILLNGPLLDRWPCIIFKRSLINCRVRIWNNDCKLPKSLRQWGNTKPLHSHHRASQSEWGPSPERPSFVCAKQLYL